METLMYTNDVTERRQNDGESSREVRFDDRKYDPAFAFGDPIGRRSEQRSRVERPPIVDFFGVGVQGHSGT